MRTQAGNSSARGGHSFIPTGLDEALPTSRNSVKLHSDWAGELSLDELLRDPTIRLLMRSDSVSDRDILYLIAHLLGRSRSGVEPER